MTWLTTSWLLAFLIALALTMYSYVVAFVPSTRWLELAQLPAWLLAISLTVPLLIFAPRMQFGRSRDRVALYASGILCVPILIFIFWQGFLLGLPAAGHYFVASTDAAQVFIVDARNQYYYRNGARLGRCTGSVNLASSVRFLKLRACGVAESDWARVEPGDQIELHGSASWFGLKYSANRVLW